MKYLKRLLYLIIFTFPIILLNMHNDDAFFEELMQDLFKDMTPEEQSTLFSEAMQLAQDMEKAGIDPNNIDEAINFIEKNIQEDQSPENHDEEDLQSTDFQPTKSKSTTIQVPESRPIEAKPFNIGDKEKVDKLKIIIKNLIAVLGEISFKAKELNFINMLNNIFAIDLENYIQRLTIIENKRSLLEEGLGKLYNNLNAQYDDLKTFNADIIIPAYQDDNPYKILGLNFDSVDEEIHNKIQILEKLYNPDEIKKTDHFKTLNQKNQNKVLKHAQIELENAQTAYLKLKTTQDRKLTDKKILDTAQSSISQERKSKSALERVKKIIESKMYQTILDIDNLLKKYAPQEEKALKEKEELEKKLLKDAEKQNEKISQKTKDDIYKAKNLAKAPEDISSDIAGKTFYQKYDAKRSNQPRNSPGFDGFRDDSQFRQDNGQQPGLGNPNKVGGQTDSGPKNNGGKRESEKDKDDTKSDKNSKKPESKPDGSGAKSLKDTGADGKSLDFEIGQSLPVKAIEKLIKAFDEEFINPADTTNQTALQNYVETNEGGTTDATNPALKKIHEIVQANKLEELVKNLDKATKNIKKNKDKINAPGAIIKSLSTLQPTKADKPSLDKLKSWTDKFDQNAIPTTNTKKDSLADWHQLTNSGQDSLKADFKIPAVGEKGFLGAIKLSVEKLSELAKSINQELSATQLQATPKPVVAEPV